MNCNDDCKVVFFEIIELSENTEVLNKLNQMDGLLFSYFEVNNLFYISHK
jgi:hypothetical protein